MNRAYALLTARAVEEGDARVITGTATTPEPDRYGDIVDPLGVQFTNPLPLLHQHNADQPVGEVRFAKPTKDGIGFTAKLPKQVESTALQERIDLAWAEVKAGLVKGVSIGFRPIEFSWMDDGGVRFISTEVLELSLVTIPANQSATIEVIKSFAAEARAASGPVRVRRPTTPPGVSGSATPVQEHKTMTLAEQIAAFEAKRAAKAARMDELMSKAADEGVTLDDAESEEYDTLTAETAKIDAHLVRLAALEKANKAKAVAVPANANGTAGTEAVPVQRASSMRIEVNDLKLPKGTAFTRYAVALMRGKGNLMQAAEIAKQWDNETPEVGRVLRAAVAAGTTTDPAWAAPLVDYQTMTGEFLELLRPATILGRIPGLRRVPFNISLPRQTAGSSVGWVGEAKPKPVSSLAFDTVTLRWAKAAGIVVMTEELVRFSSPSAEGVVRQDLVATMAHFLDVQFLDPNVAAVANVSPASITNGVTPIPASGTTADHLRADAMAAINAMLAAGLGLSSAVWIMDEVTAATIGGMMNAFGQPEFPGIGAFGGTFFGLPVITSEATPGDDGSPPDRMIVLVKANSIMLADDGQTTLDVSREASLQMNSTPDDPASATTVFVSLWQNNMVGVRAERWINWLRARTGAVQWISGVAYSLAA